MTIEKTRHYVEDVRIVVKADCDADTSYLEQSEFEDRRRQYESGLFSFVGVYARASLKRRTEQGGWVNVGTVRSAGLWGIEDDSGSDYITEVGREELAALRSELDRLGVDAEGWESLAQAAIDGIG